MLRCTSMGGSPGSLAWRTLVTHLIRCRWRVSSLRMCLSTPVRNGVWCITTPRPSCARHQRWVRSIRNSSTDCSEERSMDTERLRQFQELIALEPDDTVLRFGLGELYIEAKDFASAAEQFAEILRLDPHYSAAYRYLGQAYAALGRASEAEAVFQQGIAVAEARGDLQTPKEMQVLLRRLHQ